MVELFVQRPADFFVELFKIDTGFISDVPEDIVDQLGFSISLSCFVDLFGKDSLFGKINITWIESGSVCA